MEMAVSTDRDGKKALMSQAKCLFMTGHSYTYSPDLSQQVKTRGPCPISGPMPGGSLGQAAPDPVTGSRRFTASQGSVLPGLTLSVLV